MNVYDAIVNKKGYVQVFKDVISKYKDDKDIPLIIKEEAKKFGFDIEKYNENLEVHKGLIYEDVYVPPELENTSVLGGILMIPKFIFYLITSPVGMIHDVLKTVVERIKQVFTSFIESIKQVFVNIGNAIKNFFKSIFDSIINILTYPFRLLKNMAFLPEVPKPGPKLKSRPIKQKQNQNIVQKPKVKKQVPQEKSTQQKEQVKPVKENKNSYLKYLVSSIVLIAIGLAVSFIPLMLAKKDKDLVNQNEVNAAYLANKKIITEQVSFDSVIIKSMSMALWPFRNVSKKVAILYNRLDSIKNSKSRLYKTIISIGGLLILVGFIWFITILYKMYKQSAKIV